MKTANVKKSILNPVDFFKNPDTPEKIGTHKVVVPNQSISVKELFYRLNSGESLPIAHNVYYDSDVEDGQPFIDPTLDGDFDLADTDKISQEILVRMEAKKAQDEAQRAEAERNEAEKLKA